MTTDVTSAEIQMHAVRLMRSGAYRKGKDVVAACEEAFADVQPQQIHQALKELADRLVQNESLSAPARR